MECHAIRIKNFRNIIRTNSKRPRLLGDPFCVIPTFIIYERNKVSARCELANACRANTARASRYQNLFHAILTFW